MPLVSVVMPLFNKGAYVLRSIASVASQTVTDFELIVVDDGSTDNGAELVGSLSDSRIRLVRQVNAGPGAARNRGLTEARGRYAAFLDADDCWLPEFLEHGAASLERYSNAAAAVCGWYRSPGDVIQSASWKACGIEEGLITIEPDARPERLVAMMAYMTTGTMLMRTESVRRWGGFVEGARYAEDSTLWLRMFLNEPFYFDSRPLAKLDVEASQLSRNYRTARPIEPFLLDERTVIDACPGPLLPVLRRFLKIRACKTAAVLGFWGEWRQARSLVSHYLEPSDWRTPMFSIAVLSSWPVVKPVAWLARSFLTRQQLPPAACV